MDNPWNNLQKNENPKFSRGQWKTTDTQATIFLSNSAHFACGSAVLKLGSYDSRSQYFHATDLRELAEFCNELADHIDDRKDYDA